MLLRAPAALVARAPARLLFTSAPLYSEGPPKNDKEEPSSSSKPSFTQSTSEVAAAANAKPLPYLATPLGVEKRPSTKKPTWAERHAVWFDSDARMDDRRRM